MKRVIIQAQGRYSLGVRTRGSHPRNRGSNPRSATKCGGPGHPRNSGLSLQNRNMSCIRIVSKGEC